MPIARRPFQVKATVTQRASGAPAADTAFALPTFSSMPESQARPWRGLRKVRNS